MIDFFQRFDKYMIFKGLNDNKITVEAGISNGLIGKARKRGSLSQENISKILIVYDDLDANWLFTGKGEMLKQPEPVYILPDQPKDRQKEIDRLLELLDEKDQKLKIKDEEIDRLKKRNTHYDLQHVAEERQDPSKLKD